MNGTEGKLFGTGRLVTEIREEKGMTIKQFAEALNLRHEVLKRIESDSLPLFPWQLENIKKLLTNPLDRYWLETSADKYGEDTRIAYAKIRRLLRERKYKQAAKKSLINAYLSGYKITREEFPPHVVQLVTLVKIMANDDLTDEEAIKELCDALYLTQITIVRKAEPYIRFDNKIDYYFSFTENNILRKIAFRCHKTGDIETAIAIYECLFENAKNNYMPLDERNYEPVHTAYSLGIIYATNGDYEKSLKMREAGIKFSFKYQSFEYLYRMLYGKANCLMKLFPRDKVLETVTELVKQAYYGSKANKKDEDAEMMKKDAASDFGILV